MTDPIARPVKRLPKQTLHHVWAPKLNRTIAPPTGFTAPALGLTSWLTNLPLRKRHISVRAWNEQVAQWLAEDLASSMCMWADVTEFMSTRGHYLLYGEAVNPMSLASRRWAATD